MSRNSVVFKVVCLVVEVFNVGEVSEPSIAFLANVIEIIVKEIQVDQGGNESQFGREGSSHSIAEQVNPSY